VAQLVKALVMD